MKVTLSRIDENGKWKFYIPYSSQRHICNIIIKKEPKNIPLIHIAEINEEHHSMIVKAEDNSKHKGQSKSSESLLYLEIHWLQEKGFKLSLRQATDLILYKHSTNTSIGTADVEELDIGRDLQVKGGDLLKIESQDLIASIGRDLQVKGEDLLKIESQDLIASIKFNAYFEQNDLDEINKQTIPYRDLIKTCTDNRIVIQNVRFTGSVNSYIQDCSQANFTQGIFQNVLFDNINFRGSDFSNTFFSKVEFVNNDLEEVNFQSSSFWACHFLDCKLYETNFQESIFRPLTIIKGSTISKKNEFSSIASKEQDFRLKKCYFSNIDAQNFILKNTIIFGSRFEDSNLINVDFSSCKIFKCWFDRSRITQAKLVQVTAQYCSLNGVSLIHSNLMKSRFLDCELTGIDLRYSDLTLLSFTRCFLSGSKFYQTKRGGLTIDVLGLVNSKTENSGKTENSSQTAKEDSSPNLIRDLLFGDVPIKFWTMLPNLDCLAAILFLHKFLKPEESISFIDWSPDGNGEFQINISDFKDIVYGKVSPISLLQKQSRDAFKLYIDASSKSSSQSASSQENVSQRVEKNEGNMQAVASKGDANVIQETAGEKFAEL